MRGRSREAGITRARGEPSEHLTSAVRDYRLGVCCDRTTCIADLTQNTLRAATARAQAGQLPPAVRKRPIQAGLDIGKPPAARRIRTPDDQIAASHSYEKPDASNREFNIGWNYAVISRRFCTLARLKRQKPAPIRARARFVLMLGHRWLRGHDANLICYSAGKAENL